MKDLLIHVHVDGNTLTDYSGNLLASRDKRKYRQNRVIKLLLNGDKQNEIASKLRCSLSTIEKDIKMLRESVQL
jgi:DNA-binding NarL/FixJ family response regulator